MRQSRLSDHNDTSSSLGDFSVTIRMMIPGPVEAEDNVLAAIGSQTQPHYGAQWVELHSKTTSHLKRLFNTQHDVLLMPGAGTLAIESALTSLVPRGNSIVVLNNGFFGNRTAQMIEACGIHTLQVKAPWGQPFDPDDVRSQLKEMLPQAEADGHAAVAMAIIHHETSTGMLNSLPEMTAIAKEFGLAVIVDAVASLGGVPMKMDEWNIDVCVSVANKCIGAPPGIAVIGVSPHAWELIEANPSKHGWYLDLRTWHWHMQNWGDWHPTPSTISSNNVAALLTALENIESKGFEKHFESIEWAADCLREGMAELGFHLFPDPAHAAPIISAMKRRPDINSADFRDYLLQVHNLMIAGGLGELKADVIRVGHMGRAKEPEYIEALLEATRAYLDEMDLPYSIYPKSR